jgi:hypothetical protein
MRLRSIIQFDLANLLPFTFGLGAKCVVDAVPEVLIKLHEFSSTIR